MQGIPRTRLPPRTNAFTSAGKCVRLRVQTRLPPRAIVYHRARARLPPRANAVFFANSTINN